MICGNGYDVISDVNQKFLRPRQDQNNKTKTTGSKQRHLADLILSKWTPLLISTVVMFQVQNRVTINSTWEVVCPSRSLWRSVWQDHISQHNTGPARPRPQCARPRTRPNFWSQTGLVLRPTVSDHITGCNVHYVNFFDISYVLVTKHCLQCFDTVGWPEGHMASHCLSPVILSFPMENL